MQFTDLDQENELLAFLQNAEIPRSEYKIGFLEMIRKQHHENINSNLYAHFINTPNEEISSLFMDCLLDLIEQKSGKAITIAEAYAQTEVYTGNGRIDILIKDRRGDHTIIIENKVYHVLDNELLDYWKFIKKEDSQKVGVLLTLKPTEIPSEKNVKDKFINITHSEWLGKIKEQMHPEALSENYRVYLNDFIQTIENLTTSYKMNEAAKFYFQNAEQVLKAKQTEIEAHAFLNNQLEWIAETIGWKTHGSSMHWRNFWDAENTINTYLTIVTKDLVEGRPHFMLILELWAYDKAAVEKIKEQFEHHAQFKGKDEGQSAGNYLHLLCKNYPIETKDLERLGEIVVDCIRRDFAELTYEIIKFRYPHKDLSKWKEKFLQPAENGAR